MTTCLLKNEPTSLSVWHRPAPLLIFGYNNFMWILYLIQHSKTKKLYTGVTNDLKKRLIIHNRGKSKYTKRIDGEWILIYAEVYRSKYDAFKRESRLKQHGNAKRELKKRIIESFLEIKSGAGQA